MNKAALAQSLIDELADLAELRAVILTYFVTTSDRADAVRASVIAAKVAEHFDIPNSPLLRRDIRRVITSHAPGIGLRLRETTRSHVRFYLSIRPR